MKWDRTKKEVDIPRTIRIMKMSQEQLKGEIDDLKETNILTQELKKEINDYINAMNVVFYKLDMIIKER